MSINYYFQVFVNLKVVLNVAKKDIMELFERPVFYSSSFSVKDWYHWLKTGITDRNISNLNDK